MNLLLMVLSAYGTYFLQTKTQRIVGFFMCLLLGMFCFGMVMLPIEWDSLLTTGIDIFMS